MATRPKVKGGYSRSGHRINVLDYSEDYLLCICGWEGYAYDRDKDSFEYNESKDYPYHRKTADKIEMDFENKYAGRYGNTIKPKKREKVQV